MENDVKQAFAQVLAQDLVTRDLLIWQLASGNAAMIRELTVGADRKMRQAYQHYYNALGTARAELIAGGGSGEFPRGLTERLLAAREGGSEGFPRGLLFKLEKFFGPGGGEFPSPSRKAKKGAKRNGGGGSGGSPSPRGKAKTEKVGKKVKRA